MSEYFPELKSSGERVKIANYAKKDATGVDTSKFAKKVDLVSLKSNKDKVDINKLKNVPTNLGNLKSKVDRLDVDKLVPVPVDLSKLGDVVSNYTVKKDVYNAKIKIIEDKIPDITNVATNTILNAKINEVKSEIPSINNLATTTATTTTTTTLIVKINEFNNKIPNITNLATVTAVTAVENKISNQVKKTDYNTKLNETENKITTGYDHDKYINTQAFSKLTPENFSER